MFLYNVDDKVTATIDGFYDSKGREKVKYIRCRVLSQPMDGSKFYLLNTIRGGELLQVHEDFIGGE